MSEYVSMNQGAGGEAMQILLKKAILNHILSDNAEIGLEALDDSAVVDDIVFTIDGHTVRPLEYPGGDIGRLAVSGTVNDVAAMGATPIGLASSLIIEEGLSSELLERLMKSMGNASKEAGVPIVTGDTKVVEKGAVDGIFATTAGIGVAGEPLKHDREVCKGLGRELRWLRDSNLQDGDVIIISGTIGDHGISLLSFREGYGFETSLESDTAPLNTLMADALNVGGVIAAKDPTRGGLANTLNEWSEKSGVGISIDEKVLPFKEAVLGASELLGIDPLNVGNEGKMVLAVHPDKADEVLAAIKKHPRGQDAVIIGHAAKDVRGVVMSTIVGGRRIVEPPIGDPVPRIC